MRFPASVRPPDSVGDWIGFGAGVLIAAAIGGAVVALAVLWVVAIATGSLSFEEATCFDPTDPCKYSVYEVRNDLPATVELRECGHHCGDGDSHGDDVELRPGGLTHGSDVTAPVDDRDWWEVRAVSGRRFGCLVLDGHRHKHDGDRVVVSAMRPCSRDQATTPALASS